MYNRILSHEIAGTSKSVLLLGPRQVGKSTMINALKPEMVINLAKEDEYFQFQIDLSELEQRIQAKKPKTVFIDEIQRVPRLLNSIQAIIDANKKIKFYLTGSSARKLKKGKANLLPGRIFSYELSSLCVAEVGSDWNDIKALRFGSLPEVYSAKDENFIKKILSNYANTYLKEEILAEALVRGVDGFVRFLREAAIMSGGYLDYSKIAKKAKIPRQSTVRHFEILEDTLIAKRIMNDPDIDEDQIELVKHPRFYLFDLGVCNALQGSFDASGDRMGRMWEHLVFNQLVNSRNAYDKQIDIYNFRTRGGLEIDFILKNESKKFAIECKSATTVGSSDVSNLKMIYKYYSKIDPILIYRGKTEKKIDGIWALPLPEALKHLGL